MGLIDRSLECRSYSGNPLSLDSSNLPPRTKRVIVHGVSAACTSIGQGGSTLFTVKSAGGGEAVNNIGLMLNTVNGAITFAGGQVEATVFCIVAG